MLKIRVACSVVAVLLPLAVQAAPRIIEENKLQFKVVPDSTADSLQTYTGFFDLSQVRQIPSFADPYHLAKESAGIRKFILVHSAFSLNLSIDEVRKRTVNPLDLSKYSKHFKVTSCEGAICQGSISTTFSDNAIEFKAEVIERDTAGWASTMTALNNPDFVVAQDFTKIEDVFENGSNITAFYKTGANSTQVQSYEIFAATESAYEKASHIPFFNLDHTIQGVIRDITVDGRSSILHENEED